MDKQNPKDKSILPKVPYEKEQKLSTKQPTIFMN